jgi:hypothetical protein
MHNPPATYVRRYFRFAKGYTIRFINLGLAARSCSDRVRGVARQEKKLHVHLPESSDMKHEECDGGDMGKADGSYYDKPDLHPSVKHANAELWPKFLETLENMVGPANVRQCAREDTTRLLIKVRNSMGWT